MADHTKTGHVTCKAGIWTGSSYKHTRYIFLPKSNSSVHADRTVMIIIKKKEITMFKSALENLVH